METMRCPGHGLAGVFKLVEDFIYRFAVTSGLSPEFWTAKYVFLLGFLLA